MKRLFQILVLTAVIIFPGADLFLSGQENPGMTRYTPDFKFKDGLYLNFDQIKANNPIPKAKLLTSADYNDREFFDKIFTSDHVYYYDEMGVRQEIRKSDVWGFARNGVLYVQIQEKFNRITFVGKICHFVADITTYDSRYNYSPYLLFNNR